jgi:hypothetical protein
MNNLEELLRITNSEPYLSDGGIRAKEFIIKPWEDPDLRFLFEILIEDQQGELQIETWELSCSGFSGNSPIPAVIPMRAQFVMYNDHPLLWEYQGETYLTITNTCENIPALIGDLFKVHNEVCGAWIDFARLYYFLPLCLSEYEHKLISIPPRLVESFVKVLDKHGVSYKIGKTQASARRYQMLFCSYPGNWPDGVNFGQPHIIAEKFSARKL